MFVKIRAMRERFTLDEWIIDLSQVTMLRLNFVKNAPGVLVVVHGVHEQWIRTAENTTFYTADTLSGTRTVYDMTIEELHAELTRRLDLIRPHWASSTRMLWKVESNAD